MEFKGTKGFWVASNNFLGITCDKSHIASVWAMRCDDLDKRQDNESWLQMRERTQEERNIRTEQMPRYNALLISKAPELLEKLKQCVNMLDEIQIGESLADNIRILLVAESEQLIKESTTLPNG